MDVPPFSSATAREIGRELVELEMGSAAAEFGLDFKLCAMRTVGGFLKEAAAAVQSSDGGVAKLENSVRSLEEERRKIEAFKRELPLCMLLLTDVIEGLKKELERCRGDRFVHVFQELMPIRSRCEEEGGAKLEVDCKDKKKWMSSAQLWSDYSSDDNRNDDDQSVADERDGGPDGQEEEEENLCLESKSGADTFVPFKGMAALVMSSKQEVTPTAVLSDLSLRSPAAGSASFPISVVAGNHPGSGSVSKCAGRAPPSTAGAHLSLQLQQQRKARRCWSPELHRRFVLALQQLGGAQVATPKQIRELMKVDGLTNDEVKSHLQKYRLHTRKMPNASPPASRPVVVLGGLWVPPENHTAPPQKSVSQSGSPQSPLQLADARRAISPTAGDSCEEEGGKSECHNWR
ncbi:transcription factor NIGTH1 [Musa acuminata AAA Group]|uniref:transcription factor NIGTH1 n=1 Tax=Musa acuminata AAA Group TaxID=214697 RepID=UPI0031D0B988